MAGSHPQRENVRLLLSIRALADLGAEIASAHDFPTTARASLLMIGGAISATKGALLVWNATAGCLETAVSRGVGVPAAEARIPLAPEVCDLLRQRRAAVAVDGWGAPADAFAALLGAHFPELVVYAPLVVRDELLGVLAIGPKLGRQAYREDDLELIFTLATMLASGLYSHRLVQGLQETNQQLLDTQEQLLRAERLATLGELSAGIAHEVKNPLTSIRGFALTIVETAGISPPEEIREFAQVIAEASEQLREIIDEVRDYAKGVRRTYEVAPVALSTIVESTLSLTRFSREMRAVDLHQEVEEGVVVCVNRDKVQQVLLNLLRNAAQAIEEQRRGQIRLRVSRADGWGLIEVTDDGRGIPEETRDKIWENWYTTKGAEGTGLGLGIARKIIEDHGGRLELVRSAEGIGSTFAIRLPLAAGTSAVGA